MRALTAIKALIHPPTPSVAALCGLSREILKLDAFSLLQ